MKIWRPYTQEKTAPPALPIESARGAFLHAKDGRRIFDGISSWWLITHGHAEPEIQSAIARQAEKLEQVVFANFTHVPAEELAERLGRILPQELAHMFFSDNGSTAVEVAMKMAHQARRQSGATRRNKFVAFTHSYHGDTCGAMSVSAEGAFTNAYRGLRFEVLRCEQGERTGDPLSRWTEGFRSLLAARGAEINAVLIEPLLQGAGGMIVWPVEAVREIVRLAEAHDVYVIFDEVMTGFGRTGSLFAFEQIGRAPDFLCLSKGLTGGFLPMGLTLTKASVFERFLDSSPDKMLFHGHSFTGNALSAAAAVANLKLLDRPRPDFASVHHEVLQALRLPLRDRRVCGTVGIAELDVSENYGGQFSRRLAAECLKRDVFVRPLGSTVYLMPPYCATPQEVKDAWRVIEESALSLL